jgi:hypothetical protein
VPFVRKDWWPEHTDAIVERLRDPEWEHSRAVSAVQRVPFKIDQRPYGRIPEKQGYLQRATTIPLAPQVLTNNSVRVGIRGDDAWRPQPHPEKQGYLQRATDR